LAFGKGEHCATVRSFGLLCGGSAPQTSKKAAKSTWLPADESKQIDPQVLSQGECVAIVILR
jgi:hypothetical protein